MLFHLFGAGRVSGGIDIFLAVSGFLFTGMLLRESAAGGGPIDIGRYLARLVRRLLPAAAMVISTTLALGLLLFPSTRHEQLWGEARASFLYFENIELITSQLAYGAAGPGTSPFQHFWSLSVQGQFYLAWIGNVAYGLYLWHWPLLIFYLEVRDRDAVGVRGAAVIFAASLALAWLTYRWVEQAVSRTRVREKIQLAYGGVLLAAVAAVSSLVSTTAEN